MDKFILVIESKVDIADIQRRFLENDGFIAMVASSGEEALRVITELALPDLLVLGSRLSDMSCADFLQRLAENGFRLPSVIVIASAKEGVSPSAIRLGAMDYVVGEANALDELPSICREALKKFSLPDENAGLRKQLKKVTSELFRANRQLDDLMREDILTGVYNRGYLMNALLHSCWCSHRYGTPLSFAIFGINQLKNVNDSMGSVTGEILLREFSSTLKDRLRKTDLVGRYRAEEIGVILTGTDGEGGLKVCEELRSLVSGGSFSGLHHEARLSTSTGLAYVDGRMSMGELLELADRSFYIARESGKDQVVAMQMSQGS